jgi:hypothetical protein
MGMSVGFLCDFRYAQLCILLCQRHTHMSCTCFWSGCQISGRSADECPALTLAAASIGDAASVVAGLFLGHQGPGLRAQQQ